MRRSRLLTSLILLGLVAGIALGQVLFALQDGPAVSDLWAQAAEVVLIRPLTLLVMPLVFVSVIVGVTGIRDPSRLGLIGGATVLYFVSTMLIAVIVGTLLVTIMRPGAGLPHDAIEQLTTQGVQLYEKSGALRDQMIAARELGVAGAWVELVQRFVPTNLFLEFAAGRALGVIVFGILLGLALSLGGERSAAAVRFFEALYEALLRIVGWVVWLAPIGVFLLAAHSTSRVGLPDLVGPIGTYVIVVIAALLLHALVLLPALLAIFGRCNPWRFLYRMRRPLLTAFGTASSIATMPVALDTAVGEGGCSRRAANLVLPLGTSVNMNGTALYEAVAVLFLFQLFGIELAFGELLIVVITATLAAIGASGIPSAGLVTMVIVIAAVNTSLSGRGVQELPLASIGVILVVDRLLDMCRTTVNVWGNAVGARIITRVAPDI